MAQDTSPTAGQTVPAGEGSSDEEMSRQVAGQTASDSAVAGFFEREGQGAVTDVEAAKADADQLSTAEGDTSR